MAVRRGDVRGGGEDGGVAEEGGRVAVRGGEMRGRAGKARGDGGSWEERKGQGQTRGTSQRETWGRMGEPVAIGGSFYTPCRHTNTRTYTL